MYFTTVGLRKDHRLKGGVNTFRSDESRNNAWDVFDQIEVLSFSRVAFYRQLPTSQLLGA